MQTITFILNPLPAAAVNKSLALGIDYDSGQLDGQDPSQNLLEHIMNLFCKIIF